MGSSPGSRLATALAALAILAWAGAVGMLAWHYGAGLAAAPKAVVWSGAGAAGVGLACGLVLMGRALAGRASGGVAGVLGALFVIAVLGLAANASWMQPFHPLKSALCVAWMAGSLGLWLALRPGWARGGPSRAARVAGLIVLQICVLLVLLEVGLRVIARVRPSQVFALPDRGAESFLAENRQPPGQMVWDLRTNSKGHFDEEFEVRGQTPLVAVVGDSFSYGPVPHLFHYTTVCESLIPPVKVANIGVPSVGPPEYALLVDREAAPLKPDLIVISLFLGNDVVYMGYDRPVSTPWWRTLFDRDQLLLAHVPRRVLALRREARRLRRQGGAGDVLPALDGERLSAAELVARTPWLADPMLETPGMSVEAYLRTEAARAVAVCGPDESVYAPFFRSMESLRAAAGGTPIALLLIPDEFQVEDALWERIQGLESHMSLERDRPQERIRAWCEARSIPYEDLLPRLRALPIHADGWRHAYRLRDTHFNVLGNRIAGEGLAALIRRVLTLQ